MDYPYEFFKALLEYIYCGNVFFPSEAMLQQMAALASEYHLEPLLKSCTVQLNNIANINRQEQPATTQRQWQRQPTPPKPGQPHEYLSQIPRPTVEVELLGIHQAYIFTASELMN